tara:strand:+ start:14165 stop:14602 length:438 start_codon:yes stop_codon:yes gene_type:complete
MAGVNKVILVGNLGKDPEVRHLENGASVANFSIATSETYKDKNGNRQEQTEWHNVVLWRGLAQIAEKYLKKGSQIYIEGKLRTRSWQDKDGNTRYTTEVVGDQMTMLGGRSSGGNDTPNSNTSNEPSKNTGSADISSDDADDLPF